MKHLYLIIILALFSSCGPSQSEIDQLVENAYENGYGAGVDFGLAQSNEQEYRRGLEVGETIGEGIGYEAGFKDGQLEKFLTEIFDFAVIHWPSAFVVLAYLLLICVLIEVFRRHFLKDILEWFEGIILQVRWCMTPMFGELQKITVQKEKWGIIDENIEESKKTFTLEIAVQNTRIEKYTTYINAGMPKEQEEIAHKDIFLAKKKTSDLQKLIVKGGQYQEKIRQISNGLDMLSYRVQTLSHVNIQDNFENFNDLEHNIKSFLKWDIGSLGENDDLDNEYYFTAS